jgi:prepilin-type N-terminal cleavage/methylation domain-containing protein
MEFSMTQSTLQTRRSERGFTLVELAIVMIIIGLLIGGILKGQELINNARVSSSVTQIKGAEAAINTFRDKYSALPGDIDSPDTRLPNCGTGTTCIGAAGGGALGNGYINGASGNVGAANEVIATNEAGVVWVQLTVAGLLTGNVDPNAAWSQGTSLPDFNMGGKMFVANETVANPTGIDATNGLTGHVLVAGTQSVAGTLGTEQIRVSAAANIDAKLDDGQPNSGSVRATGSAGTGAANCYIAGAAGVYNQAQDGSVCGLLVRVLN